MFLVSRLPVSAALFRRQLQPVAKHKAVLLKQASQQNFCLAQFVILNLWRKMYVCVVRAVIMSTEGSQT